MKKIATALSAALALSLAPAAAAPAATSKGVKKVYRDCADGQIAKRHAKKNLKKAKRKLPADLRQYSGCKQAIDKELKKRRGKQ